MSISPDFLAQSSARTSREKDPQTRSSLRLQLIAVVVGGLLAAILITGALIYLHSRLHAFSSLDHWLPNDLYKHSSPHLTAFMRLLTTIGSPLWVVIWCLSMLGVLLLRKRWGEAIGIFGSEVGGLLINQAAKAAFKRERPDWSWLFVHEKNYSFPSGHAMLGIISFGTITFLLCRYYHSTITRTIITVFFTLLVFGIGFSRIYLGAHFPSDILAGWIAGGIWLLFVMAGVELLHRVVPAVRPPDDQPQMLND